MKLTINPTEATKRIKKAERVIQGKSVFPIFDNFLISVRNNNCNVTASDNEMQVSLAVPIISSEGDFDFCTDAKKFSAIIGSIKSDEVTIDVDTAKNELEIKHSKGRLSLPCVDTKDFPLFALKEEEQKTTMVNAVDVYNAVNCSSYASSTDDLRPQLKGVYFDFVDGGYYTVATDTHKLVKIKNGNGNIEQIESFIMPSKVAGIIGSLIESYSGDLLVKNDGDMAEMVIFDNLRLTFKQVNGRFPNYNMVFPEESTIVAVANKSELIESLRRCLLVASQHIGNVIFKFNQNELHLSVQDLDYSRSAEEIIQCEYNGEPLDIMFNGNDFLTILNNMPTTDGICKFSLTDGSKPIVIQPNNGEDMDVAALLMPMYMG